MADGAFDKLLRVGEPRDTRGELTKRKPSQQRTKTVVVVSSDSEDATSCQSVYTQRSVKHVRGCDVVGFNVLSLEETEFLEGCPKV